jgi:sterol desaturase/sphingolipid hydroxylase (fatty acid hydroxylase superfamily)
MSTGMCSSIITKLRALRLLPPPANELVPLLFAIATFSCATLIFGHDHLQELWTTMIMIQSYPPENIFVFGTFAVYMTMYWGYSFIIHMAEHVIPALHHFKIQPEIKVTPWSEVLRMVPLVLFNQVGLGLPLLKVMFLILTWRRHGYGSPEAMAEFATQVPTIGRFVLTMVANVLCTEIWFYAIHRQLHSNKLLYRWIHKLHHSYKAPSCLESAYVHPIEFMLNSFTVLLIGPLVTGAPLMTWWMWMWTATFLQVHDHSGYWFPFLPRVLMHDYHHQRIDCCYGILGLLDGMFHTDGGFLEFVNAHEEESNFNGDSSKKEA